jgi:hypothetical protein
MMMVERTNSGRGFWLRWMPANCIGWSSGWIVFALLSSLDGTGTEGTQIGHLVGWVVGGAIIGLFQWRVLRQYVRGSAWTILGSSAGFTLGFIVGYAVGGPPLDFIVGFAAVGLLGGIAQWFALRRQFDRAAWWVLVSSLGFTLGGLLGLAVILPIGDAIDAAIGGPIAFAIILAILGAVGGALGGATSGLGLLWLLRPLVPQAKNVALT